MPAVWIMAGEQNRSSPIFYTPKLPDVKKTDEFVTKCQISGHDRSVSGEFLLPSPCLGVPSSEYGQREQIFHRFFFLATTVYSLPAAQLFAGLGRTLARDFRFFQVSG